MAGTVKGLNSCRHCGSAAVEQTRSKMGPGDYKRMIRRDASGFPILDDNDNTIPHPDYYLEVEQHPDWDSDARISCSKCQNATGWNQVDAKMPDGTVLPGAALELMRRKWNASNPPGAQSSK